MYTNLTREQSAKLQIIPVSKKPSAIRNKKQSVKSLKSKASEPIQKKKPSKQKGSKKRTKSSSYDDDDGVDLFIL